MEEKDMLEIVDIRDATEEEIKEYTRKQESPEWQQQGTVKDVMNKLREQERRSMEIKYRVWDKDRKEYLSAGNVFIRIQPGEMPEQSDIYLDLIDETKNKYKNRFVVEAFTGMKDIHGIEIYEGDILMGYKNKDDLAVVEYGEFFVIDAETYNRVDKIIGWHTHVLKTDVLSVCEPFCLTMPLNEDYIVRREYSVLKKRIHQTELKRVRKV